MKNKKLYFLGLGISNLAAIAKLAPNNEIYFYDDKIDNHDDLKFVHYAEIDFGEIDYFVVAPSVPLEFPKRHPAIEMAKQANVKIIGDIELFFMQFEKLPKIIAITGTNGKSTTTKLTHYILSNKLDQPVFFGGNIGVPIFDLPVDNMAVYVIEVSSFQLDLLNDLEFSYSVLLNITPDHLDRHHDLEGYVKAKIRVFSNRNRDNKAIICSDNPITYGVFESLENKKVKFSCDEIKQNNQGVFYKNYNILNNLLDLKSFSNPQNLLASLIIAEMEGIDLADIKDLLLKFEPLEHRFEMVLQYENIMIYNDSKATNADSTENALKQLDNILWIAGGIAKEGGIESLKKYFTKIKKVYLFGEAEQLFYKQIDNMIETELFNQDFQKLVAKVIDDAKLDKSKTINILFSPACASFDMFANFAARGKIFKNLVEEILK
jgi:UDP-N-acetylmuramoylalanine--D-glutamate ligase